MAALDDRLAQGDLGMFLNDLLKLDDRTKLMVIDWIIDTLPEELGEELTDGLAVAFERAEENRPNGFLPIYPAGGPHPVWAVWRTVRDKAIVEALENAKRFRKMFGGKND